MTVDTTKANATVIVLIFLNYPEPTWKFYEGIKNIPDNIVIVRILFCV